MGVETLSVLGVNEVDEQVLNAIAAIAEAASPVGGPGEYLTVSIKIPKVAEDIGPGRAIKEAWLVTRSRAALGQESLFLPAGAPAANPTPSRPDVEELGSSEALRGGGLGGIREAVPRGVATKWIATRRGG